MKKILTYSIIIVLTAFVFSCREQFTPPAITNYTNYLVVEGMINTGTDSTIIKLSRTVQLSNKTTVKVETKATVTIESDANNSYLLKEITSGTYASPPLGLNKTARYRLRIVTSDKSTYLSDFVTPKDSPPIDSVGYKILPTGLQIYASTHDNTNNSRYYRWDYAETWEFHSAYSSSYIASGTEIAQRPPTKEIYFCWGNDVSSDIVLASSEKLTNDVINQATITTIPSTSEKLEIGYSILVKQYALTEDAFNFWQNLRKNTEELGSIFDAQPSQIQGNIHNSNNAAEPVFGYISAGTTQQKRITVLYPSWPVGWGYGQSAYPNCIQDSVLKAGKVTVVGVGTFTSDKTYDAYYFGPGIWIPLSPIVVFPPGSDPDTIGYYGSGKACVDCTLRGTNKRPSYWPPGY